MANTNILELPELSESQSGKYLTHNEALRQIEGMLVRVIDRNSGGPPGAPTNGNTYIVDVKSGAWNVAEATVNDIAYYYGSAWHFYTPIEGVRVWVNDEDKVYAYSGTAWTAITGLTTSTSLTVEESTGNKGGMAWKFAEASANITAAASITINVNVPTNCKLLGCQLRVETALTSGEMWNSEWNDGSTVQSIVTAQSEAQNTKVNKWFDVNANPDITDAETDIVITKNGGGSFTAAGAIRAIAYYNEFDTMASV